jgi:stress-induced morphogen
LGKSGYKVETLEIANESSFLSSKEELYDEQNFKVSIQAKRFLDVICSSI